MSRAISRRKFLASSAVCYAMTRAVARARQGEPKLDRHGGLRSRRFDATGFFRLERRDRWWLVTPQGHAWLGFGLNHVHPTWLDADYNREFWRKRFGAADASDAVWQAGLRSLVQSQVNEIGYNHFGVHNDFRAIAPLGYPEIRVLPFVEIPHSFVPSANQFHDVFSRDFERHCDGLAAEQCGPQRQNPLIVGWAFTDCPILTDAEAAARPVVTHGSPRGACPTLPRVLRNMAGDAPGKRAWLKTVRARYADDMNAFNDCYGTNFANWDALLSAKNWRELTDMANPRELADNQAFLEQVVDRYYAVACAAVRRHAPRHLIFGDKLNGNTDGAEAVVKITARHTDLVFYQMYDRWPRQQAALDRWRELTDKPAFNGDGTFSTTSEMMPNPHGPHARDQAERGEWAYEFAKHAFARDDFVGWTVCGWVDTWKTMPRKEHKQHSGFFSPTGEPHADYTRHLRRIADDLYDFAKAAV